MTLAPDLPMPLLHRLFGLGPDGSADLAALPQPKAPLCLVGDLHGRADLLEALLSRIAAEPEAASARLIFAGDLIDRGPDSAKVLHRVRSLTETRPGHAVHAVLPAEGFEALKGSFEPVMKRTLTNARQYLRSGVHATAC